MKRLMLALAVLFGGMPKVEFGLEKAKAIYKSAAGRFDQDQTKAVPFAVIETAKAMGAEITLFVEANAEKLGIASDIKTTQGRAADIKAAQEGVIEELRRDLRAAEKTIEKTMAAAEVRVGLLQEDEKEIDSVVAFFSN